MNNYREQQIWYKNAIRECKRILSTSNKIANELERKLNLEDSKKQFNEQYKEIYFAVNRFLVYYSDEKVSNYLYDILVEGKVLINNINETGLKLPFYKNFNEKEINILLEKYTVFLQIN